MAAVNDVTRYLVALSAMGNFSAYNTKFIDNQTQYATKV